MHNIKLTIAYDGTRYAGWQTQESRRGAKTASRRLRTVQGEIEFALQKILQKKIRIEGSGRTDAGVHALAQVAHFQTEKVIDPLKLQCALNGLLPKDIVIAKCELVSPDFHARFDAKKKTYAYCIVQSRVRMPFLGSFAWCVRHPLEIGLMRREAKVLLGRHDFKSFQAADRCERSSVTDIKKIILKRQRGSCLLPFLKDVSILSVEIEATGFSRGMVRNIIGTLVDIGRGKFKKGDMKKILEAKDRRKAGVSAPASGLYLMGVDYE